MKLKMFDINLRVANEMTFERVLYPNLYYRYQFLGRFDQGW